MNVRSRIVPSQRMGDSRLMQDYSVTVETDHYFAAAVGDMANNLVGKTSYILPDFARIRDIDPSTNLNGGLVGSIYLKQHVPSVITNTGVELIRSLGDLISSCYKEIGLLSDGQTATDLDPAERFTGYIGHVLIDAQNVTLTSLGDVYIWINGRLVSGEDKAIDQLKGKLVDDVYGSASTDHLAGFNADCNLDGTTYKELQRRLEQAIAQQPLDRQLVYRAVDDLVTPWQIRTLQNNPGHKLGYGAIDGTKTPEGFVTTMTLARESVQTIVIHTDGFSASGIETLGSIDELQPVNATYSEQTALQIIL